ncbi:hypothetical protein [Pantoea coffeiphila]|uniref:Phage protein n=1 Tax=Pantoea coffeiphila TaxID=1465635 RepID=A0A2S9I857_9GAMM|nr:hypothetical protein [Pantoea coffeiphila]PRD13978.1 hypothetical protein CQW29_18405 [Pantoea coffeiphila]
MAINYQRMRDTATRLLAENGSQYDVVRKGSISMSGGKEVHEPDHTFTATGVRIDYDPKEIDGEFILAGDVRIIFTAEPALRVGDLVMVDGKQYRIFRPNPIKPGAVVISYRTQLRA